MTATRPVLFSVFMLVSSVVVELIATAFDCRTDRQNVRGPVRGVLKGHPSSARGGVHWESWTHQASSHSS